ncbi:MAG: Holliday junction branch migration protein RuvA [Patescibacteria group bacterium]
MIGSIKGQVTYKGATFLVIEANGVGYKTYVTSAILSQAREGKEIFLWTYMAVRENALDLYGFPEREEIEFFGKLISIPGIGPKSGLSVLNTASVRSLKQGISLGDTTHLVKVSGIGRKSAEKIVLGLKDKLGVSGDEKTGIENEIDALEALTSLGYSQREAREALQKADASIVDTGEKIKSALRILGSKLK